MSTLTTVLKSRFDEAKTAINSRYQISTFLESKGIHVESNRQRRCPFHDDSTPSFSVNFETNEWKCFGCQDGGHFVDIWKTYYNKYESTNYTIYSAIETILSLDVELQGLLGFASIYKTENDEFNLFAQEDGNYQFDALLSRGIKVKQINTDSMKQVLDSLKSAEPEKLVRFIADCQNGFTESQLISKYYKQQDNIDAYIDTLAVVNKETAGDLTSAFLEALE